MILHISKRDDRSRPIGGIAHIVISINERSDAVDLVAFSGGEIDSRYAPMPVDRVPAEVAKLVAELRAQLRTLGAAA